MADVTPSNYTSSSIITIPIVDGSELGVYSVAITNSSGASSGYQFEVTQAVTPQVPDHTLSPEYTQTSITAATPSGIVGDHIVRVWNSSGYTDSVVTMQEGGVIPPGDENLEITPLEYNLVYDVMTGESYFTVVPGSVAIGAYDLRIHNSTGIGNQSLTVTDAMSRPNPSGVIITPSVFNLNAAEESITIDSPEISSDYGNSTFLAQVPDAQPLGQYELYVSNLGGTSPVSYFDIAAPNAAPTDISLDNQSIDEHLPSGSSVGLLSATDSDIGDSHSFSFASDGVDNASFSISGSYLLASDVFDFNTKSSYSVKIRATDSYGEWVEKEFTINVNSVDEAPTDITLDNATFNETDTIGHIIGSFTTTDPDLGDTFTYTLASGGDDNSKFAIIDSYLLVNADFDYLVQTSFWIRVRATDSTGLWYEKDFQLTLTEGAKAPTDISVSNLTINEHNLIGDLVGVISSTDPNTYDAPTYSLPIGYGDNASFEIVGDHLNAAETFTYNTKNSYSIRIKVTDVDGLSYTEDFSVSVLDVNEAPTNLILSNGTIDENLPIGTLVGILSSTDPDVGSGFTYTFASGGTDNASFSISDNELRSAESFNHEVKSTYSINLRTTDQFGLFYEKSFEILVNDVNEAPSGITISNDSVNESMPIGTLVGSFTTTDADVGDTFTYTIPEGDNDNVLFSISGDQLLTAQVFDYDVRDFYEIYVTATDANGLSVSVPFTIYVNDVNQAPTDIALSNLVVSENLPIGTLVGTLTAEDSDVGDTHTFTFASGGVDNASFSISGDQLLTAESFLFFNKNEYSISIRATDSQGLYVEKSFLISIEETLYAPTDISLDNATFVETDPVGTLIGTLSVEDANIVDSHVFSLAPSVLDNDSFSISGTQLLLNTTDLNALSVDTYTISVKVTDSKGLSFTKEFPITALVGDYTLASPSYVPYDGVTPIAGWSLPTEDVALGAIIGEIIVDHVDPPPPVPEFTHVIQQSFDTFGVSGDNLVIANPLRINYEQRQSETIVVTSTDAYGNSTSQTITIQFVDTYEAPSTLPSWALTENYNFANVGNMFEPLTTEYDGERELYDMLQMEAYNRMGTPFLWYVVSYNTEHNKVFGEDMDRRLERGFGFMGMPEALPEERKTFGFRIEGLDSFVVYVNKIHFHHMSSKNLPSVEDITGKKFTDFSLNHLTEDKGTGSITWREDFLNAEFTTEFNIGLPFKSYIPKVGDVVKMRFNDYLYEVKSVKEEDEMFLQHKHSWTIRLSKFTNTHLNVNAQDFNDERLASLLDVDVLGMQANVSEDVDALKLGTDGEAAKDSFPTTGKGRERILYEPKTGEKNPNVKNEGW